MSKKVLCKVETDIYKISEVGRSLILQNLKKLNKVNYIFEGKTEYDCLYVKIPDFLQKTSENMPAEWISVLHHTKEKTKNKYTFLILESSQLEFDF